MKSHIVKTNAAIQATTTPVAKAQLLVYSTMSGKQVLIKTGLVMTGKGFKESKRVHIVGVAYFNVFCDYFPKGAKVMLLYIESTLTEKVVDAAPSVRVEVPENPAPLTITLEELLRNYPVLSRAFSDKFYLLFHHNNPKHQRLRIKQNVPLDDILAEFKGVVAEAFAIVQNGVSADTPEGERIYNLLHSLSLRYALMDLNKLIHEYVELRLYDRVWSLLVYQFQSGDSKDANTVLTTQLYHNYLCLSINQLDLPMTEPWHVNLLCKRVADAIDVFSRLGDSGICNQRQKLRLVKDAVSILTEGSLLEFSGTDMVVDADTLIGLLIMVVVHSKVAHLEAHLHYIRNYGPKEDNELMGYLSYILSNLDAVIFHLADSHHEEMLEYSRQNYKFWLAIQDRDTETLKKMLLETQEKYQGAEVPTAHFLHSRNIHGESCLGFAVKAKDFSNFRLLLETTQLWISLEDILFERNTSNNQNMLMVALSVEAHEIALEIIEMLLESATLEEQKLYFNSRDINGRTVGHYLSYNLEALARIGSIIDWDIQDNASHTPLFSMCRCYDHADYEALISTAFECFRQSSNYDSTFAKHTDRLGNTLLHALLRAFPQSGLLNEKELVNINQANSKNLTPIEVYVRYGRIENLRHVLADKRLIYDFEDDKNFYNLLDYYSFSASKAALNPSDSFKQIHSAVVQSYFSQKFPHHASIEIGVINSRYDSVGNDWIINTMVRAERTVVRYIALDKVRQLVKVQKVSVPVGFFLSPERFWVNFPKGKLTVPMYSKFRANRLLEHLTMYFALMNYVLDTAKTTFRQLFSQCKEDFNLMLLLMKDANSRLESEKNRYGDVRLKSQQIKEIETFLVFSQEAIQNYGRKISILHKLVAVAGVKQGDFRYVSDQFLAHLEDKALTGPATLELRLIDTSYSKLGDYIVWLLMCVDELLDGCKKLADKLAKWTSLYAHVKDINSKMLHFEEQVVKKPESAGSEDGSLSRRSTFSLEGATIEEEENSGLFFNFAFDNKSLKYKRLLLEKSEQVAALMALNVEIKMHHEAIALETSHFFTFRGGFVNFAIKQFVSGHIVLLRHRHYELQRVLLNIRKINGTTATTVGSDEEE